MVPPPKVPAASVKTASPSPSMLRFICCDCEGGGSEVSCGGKFAGAEDTSWGELIPFYIRHRGLGERMRFPAFVWALIRCSHREQTPDVACCGGVDAPVGLDVRKLSDELFESLELT